MAITPEDERRYGLAPLPEVPFCGKEECARRRAEYEADRAAYRALHPHREKTDS